MMQPYARLVVLHLAVLFGGWIVLTLGSPLLALLVLVALKTAADVRVPDVLRHEPVPVLAHPPHDVLA